MFDTINNSASNINDNSLSELINFFTKQDKGNPLVLKNSLGVEILIYSKQITSVECKDEKLQVQYLTFDMAYNPNNIHNLRAKIETFFPINETINSIKEKVTS